MPPTFHIARSNCHAPNFSGVPLPLTWCHLFGIRLLPKSGNPDSGPLKGSFYDCFWTKSIFLAKLSTFACSTSYISRKMWYGIFLVRPVRRQNFANTLQLHCTPDLTHCLIFLLVFKTADLHKSSCAGMFYGGASKEQPKSLSCWCCVDLTLQGFIFY